AQRIGLQPGDIIAGLDGRPVETVAQLRERLERTRSGWAFAIKRGGRLLNLQIQG
ncbi:MAG: PDZ domain-containing protein, partial [Rhodospirillales bacterium]|nr:PDZ domain-containing protein [Rhodospirillales bacterium]